ncbi:MAG: glycosyltransferase [Phycisphaera sp.]|nr:glycosyltransferase [Phycisphaera sp.]
MSLRFCLLTPTFLPLVGGAEYDADVVCRGLLARGHVPVVLTQRRNGTPPALPYKVIGYRRPPSQHLWAEALAWPIARAHRRERFDALLAFDAYPLGYAASRVSRRLRLPLVYAPQGADLYDCCHDLRKLRVLSMIQRGYRAGQHIILLSEWMGGKLRARVPGKLPPTSVVYNGIDLGAHDKVLEASRGHRFDPPIEKPFVLHLARVHPVKGQTLAVEAVGRLSALFRERGLIYVVAGDGQDMVPLRALIERLGVGDIVLTVGTRTGLDKAWLLAHALFHVSASYEEAFGNVVIEAMASGLPMLASSAGAHPELVGRGGWGALFKSGDVEDMARQLRVMIERTLEPEQRRVLSEAALRWRESFTMDRMIDGYERVLVEAVEAGELDQKSRSR